MLCKPDSMTAGLRIKIWSWTVVVPVLAAVLLALTWGRKPGVVVQIIVAIALAGAVLAAVNHAEVVAHRVGEPFGSLVLAIAVTIIESRFLPLFRDARRGSRALFTWCCSRPSCSWP
jgi:Ca2+:H+ antiporter